MPASRTPKWRCGRSIEPRPLAPTEPIGVPTDTSSPARTSIAPRCRYEVSKRPSAVRTETVSPAEPTVPANVTVPAVAALTLAPDGATTSIPRC